MAEVPRITPEETREKVVSGKALLICAYDNDAHFTQYKLEGAVSLSSFKMQSGELTKDQELIFYCN